MIKKIIAGIAIAGLMAGTGCGIGYSIKYNNLKTEYEHNQNQDVSGLLNNIEIYRAQVKELTAENESLKAEIESLKADNASLNSQIDGLNTIKSEHETTIVNLQKSIDENNTTISALNAEISSLELQKAELESSNEDKTEEIVTLNQQISNLQTLSSQLQKTNAINVATITTLNNQISNLNIQIKELSNKVQNNDSSIAALQNRNAELEATIAYYEQYIAQQENETQVVATFEFDGSVIGINILSKGATTSIEDPQSTERVIFNGWTVDGQPVDLATYAINTNTKFIADITYKYNVKFVSNNETVSSTYYLAEDSILLPEEPTREGYTFDGWTINGTDIVDPTSYAPGEDITFTAKYTKVHTVTFIVGEQTYTQKVKNNEYASQPEITFPDGKLFKGWLYVDSYIDLSSYPIVSNIVFTADLVNKNGFLTDYQSIAIDYTASEIFTTDDYVVVFNKNTKTLNYYNHDMTELVDSVTDSLLFNFIYGTSSGNTIYGVAQMPSYSLISIDLSTKTITKLYSGNSQYSPKKFCSSNNVPYMYCIGDKIVLFTKGDSNVSYGYVGVLNLVDNTFEYKNMVYNGYVSTISQDEDGNIYALYGQKILVVYNEALNNFVSYDLTNILKGTSSYKLQKINIVNNAYNIVIEDSAGMYGIIIDISLGTVTLNNDLTVGVNDTDFLLYSSGINNEPLVENDTIKLIYDYDNGYCIKKFDKINKTYERIENCPIVSNGISRYNFRKISDEHYKCYLYYQNSINIYDLWV